MVKQQEHWQFMLYSIRILINHFHMLLVTE